jgi:hypothetical protein
MARRMAAPLWVLSHLAPIAPQRAGLLNRSSDLHDADRNSSLVEKATASSGG